MRPIALPASLLAHDLDPVCLQAQDHVVSRWHADSHVCPLHDPELRRNGVGEEVAVDELPSVAVEPEVQVVAVSTGAALELGKRGDVDMVMVHAKETELAMVREGWFVHRHDLMYNDFVIIGPENDPAGIESASKASGSLAAISQKSNFVSRGDNSGTHKKELSLWKQAGMKPDPKTDNWYLSVGQGMAKTVRIAAQKKAYTMTDRGTWLALTDEEDLRMKIVTEGDPALFNQYGVMVVSPKKHAHTKYKEAKIFIDWLISETGQKTIGSFRNKTGKQLFTPNAR